MKLVQFGGGNIGRGFIGALFAKNGYEVVFIDVNDQLISSINSRKEYIQRVISREAQINNVITGVRAVNINDKKAVAQEINSADIIATSVGMKALPFIINVLLDGLRMRWKNGKPPVDMLICENMMDANHYIDKLIQEKLSNDEISIYKQNFGLVETSIGRMVPVMTEAMKAGDELLVCVEPYSYLPVDADAFKGKIPEFKEIKPYSPFEFFVKRKLYIHNMAHAIIAYLGNHIGKKYIFESLHDPSIAMIAAKAMIESGISLSKQYNVSFEGIYDNIQDLLYRFQNADLGDTNERVGADIPRKLNSSDRLVGAARMIQQTERIPGFVSIGIAAALYQHCQNTAEDPRAALEKLSGIEPHEELSLYIMNVYKLLESNAPLSELIAQAEKYINSKMNDVI